MREFGDGPGYVTAPFAMPSEHDRETRNHEPDFVTLEVGARSRAENRYSAGFKCRQERPTMVLPHTVQEQCDLVVVLDDLIALQEVDKVSEPLRLVAGVPAPDADDRWIVGMTASGRSRYNPVPPGCNRVV